MTNSTTDTSAATEAHVTSSDLLARPGWTIYAAARFLGDRYQVVPHFYSRNGIKVFSAADVTAVEQSPEWSKWLKVYAKKYPNAEPAALVAIPLAADDVRLWATSRGARWDAERKEWLVPGHIIAEVRKRLDAWSPTPTEDAAPRHSRRAPARS